MDLHRDIRFVVDFVQISFEIFDIIPHLFLVVVKQFQEELINNDSHPADIPNSHGPDRNLPPQSIVIRNVLR